jgi:iron complex outermembrane receptor protein
VRRPAQGLRLPRAACALGAALLALPCAWAGDGPLRPPASAPSAGALPTVTTTARKREESAHVVPISMTVVDGTAAATATTPADSNAGLARAASNVAFADSGGQYGNLFVIRGVGSFAPLSADDTSVVMYFNEMARSVYGAPPSLIDIDRVEILRGPQGTLFGRNTQGGAVHVVPNAPTFQRTFSATTEAGTHGHALGDVVANMPFSESLAGRVALRYSRRDGTVPNVATGGKDGRTEVGAARGSLLWLLGDRTIATFTGFHDARASSAPRFIWRQNPAFPQSAVAPAGNIRWKDTGASLKFEHEFDTLRLTALTGYQDSRSHQPFDLTDGLVYAAMTQQAQSLYNLPYADYANIHFREQVLQQEVRLSTREDGPWSWTAGVHALRSRFGNDTQAVASAAAFNFQTQNGTQDNRIRTDSIGLFGEGTASLSARLKATLGLRYTHEAKDADYLFVGNGNAAVVPRSSHSQRLTDHFVTGRVGLSYDWTADAMVYATVSRGAVGAGFPAVQANGAYGKAEAPYPSSKSWTHEAGFKTLWLDRRLGLNGAVFHNEVRNGHLIVFNPSQLLFGTASLDYRSQGVELEALVKPNPRLQLSAGLGHTRAELVDVPGGSPTGARSGNRVPNMPRLNATLGLQYDTPLRIGGAEGQLKTSVAWQYVGRRAADVKDSFTLPGYGLVHARLGWQHGHWEIYGFASNLLGKHYLVAGQAWTAAVSSVRLGQPRLVGLGATARF